MAAPGDPLGGRPGVLAPRAGLPRLHARGRGARTPARRGRRDTEARGDRGAAGERLGGGPSLCPSGTAPLRRHRPLPARGREAKGPRRSTEVWATPARRPARRVRRASGSGRGGPLRPLHRDRGAGHARANPWPRGPPATGRSPPAASRRHAAHLAHRRRGHGSRRARTRSTGTSCSRGRPRRARAVACVAGLAVRLLGAGAPEASALHAAGFDRLPDWLEGELLEQWGRGSDFRLPLADEISRPRRLLRELVRHWPNGIEASAGVGAPFGDGPRWPYQLAFVAVRAARFARTRGRFDR